MSGHYTSREATVTRKGIAGSRALYAEAARLIPECRTRRTGGNEMATSTITRERTTDLEFSLNPFRIASAFITMSLNYNY